MKGFSLCSIVTIAMLASPAFAEDTCTLGMQKLSDNKAALTTMASPLKEQVEEHMKAAEEAQRMGDSETCGTHAEKALQLLQGPNKDGAAEAN
ncbi:hypothetical protein [Pseudomonas sp.]|uniref:hypothetical protein n=1 Tax=Pseudomonas sp. TaxID=306 RepID=UPI002D053DD8|nr:hypothetical protein [Pseudomonas sp.]HUE90697.1 hypothetical protein [Pseudomonas sp.]